jgi:hypothetical protein
MWDEDIEAILDQWKVVSEYERLKTDVIEQSFDALEKL